MNRFSTKVVLIFALWAATAKTEAQAMVCTSNCGYIWKFPVVAGIRFNLDDCNLYKSFILKICQGGSTSLCDGLFEVEKFSTEISQECNNNFERLHGSLKKNKNFKNVSIDVTEASSCSGQHDWKFNTTYINTKGTFNDAKVLCNDGQILAILSKEPRMPRAYAMYYETSNSENYYISDEDLSQFVPIVKGPYCKDLLSLISNMLVLLKNTPSDYDNFTSACGSEYVGFNDTTSYAYNTTNPTKIDIIITTTTTTTISPTSNGTIRDDDSNHTTDKDNIDKPSDEDSSNPAIIIGAALAGVSVVIIGGILYYRRRKPTSNESVVAVPVIKNAEVVHDASEAIPTVPGRAVPTEPGQWVPPEQEQEDYLPISPDVTNITPVAVPEDPLNGGTKAEKP